MYIRNVFFYWIIIDSSEPNIAVLIMSLTLVWAISQELDFLKFSKHKSSLILGSKLLSNPFNWHLLKSDIVLILITHCSQSCPLVKILENLEQIAYLLKVSDILSKSWISRQDLPLLVVLGKILRRYFSNKFKISCGFFSQMNEDSKTLTEWARRDEHKHFNRCYNLFIYLFHFFVRIERTFSFPKSMYVNNATTYLNNYINFWAFPNFSNNWIFFTEN